MNKRIRTKAKQRLIDSLKVKKRKGLMVNSRFGTDLDKHIRCKCRKLFGMKKLHMVRSRCKTEVIARGL